MHQNRQTALEMKLDRPISAPVVAAVGIWDPFVPDHQQLASDLAIYARQNGLCSLAVVIDPAPSVLLFGAGRWVVYNALETRLHLLRDCGIEAIMLMPFTQESFLATAADFFQSVMACVALDELWLGVYQMIGSGAESSPENVEKLAQQYRVRLKLLPGSEVTAVVNEVRHLMTEGCLAEAIRITGRPPVRARGTETRVRWAWHTGLYQAAVLERPTAQQLGAKIPIMAEPDDGGGASFEWPDPQISYLAFLSGPADGGINPE